MKKFRCKRYGVLCDEDETGGSYPECEACEISKALCILIGAGVTPEQYGMSYGLSKEVEDGDSQL